MSKDPVHDVYRQDLPDDRPLSAADISGLRFGTALRGYAMDQVDDILDRLGREIAERDALIARLRSGSTTPEVVQAEHAEEASLWSGHPSPTSLGSEPDQTAADPR